MHLATGCSPPTPPPALKRRSLSRTCNGSFTRTASSISAALFPANSPTSSSGPATGAAAAARGSAASAVLRHPTNGLPFCNSMP